MNTDQILQNYSYVDHVLEAEFFHIVKYRILN